MSNLDAHPDNWLAQQFASEFCDECGGDAIHHDALPVMGNWFALCRFPATDTGRHPLVECYRERYDRTVKFEHVLREARGLLEPGEEHLNPEYLRGMCELIARCFLQRDEMTDELAEKISVMVAGEKHDR